MEVVKILTTLFLTANAIVFAESPVEKVISEAESQYYEAQAKFRANYRRDLAAALSLGGRVEVYLLDFEAKDTPSDFYHWEDQLENDEFPILPYGSKSKILKRVTLTKDQKKTFIPKLQKVVGVQGDIDGGAACHFPVHGVRIHGGDKIIFQTSFCWVCDNFAISYPDGPSWVEIRGGDIFEAFSLIMPIPQSEVDRFEARFGSKHSRSANRTEDEGKGRDELKPEAEERFQ